MIALKRRLRRIEAQFIAPYDPEAARRLALFRQRKERHATERGEKLEPWPERSPNQYQYRTLAEVLRQRLNRPESKR